MSLSSPPFLRRHRRDWFPPVPVELLPSYRVKLRIFIIAITIAVAVGLLQMGAGAQQQTPPEGFFVSGADTLRITSYSDYQLDALGNITNTSPVVTSIVTGTGEMRVGQTVTCTGCAGGATIAAVSSQAAQLPPSTTTFTAVTHTNTTLDGIPTIWCNQISAQMLVTKADVPALAYTTGACAAGSVTLSAAATGSTTSNTTFTPSMRMSANASATTPSVPMVINANSLIFTVAGDIIPAGAVQPVAITSFTETPTTNGAAHSTTSAALPAGYLRNLVVSVSTGTPVRKSAWFRLDLLRGGNVQKVITSGGITANKPWFWPGQPNEQLGDMCRPMLKAYARPLAGDGIRISVPTCFSYEWISGATLFSTSTTIADRFPGVEISSREGIPSYYGPLRASAQQAFETVLYQVAQATSNPVLVDLGGYLDLGAGVTSGAAFLTVGIDKIALVGGGSAVFKLNAANIQAADQWTEPQVIFDVCMIGSEATP